MVIFSMQNVPGGHDDTGTEMVFPPFMHGFRLRKIGFFAFGMIDMTQIKIYILYTLKFYLVFIYHQRDR
jgi:hypothetical protein